MSAELRTLTSYFAVLDGTKSWEEVKPHALNLAHRDLTIHHGDHRQHHAEWLATVETFVRSGGSVDMLQFEAVEGGGSRPPMVRYTIRLNFADGTSSVASSTATFQEGRLLRVEPDEGARGAYDKLFGTTAADEVPVATEQ